jgi:sarcosine oxidase subunit gamma
MAEPGNREGLRPAQSETVALATSHFRSLLNLRCRPRDKDTVSALGDVLGLPLPLEPNRFTGSDSHALIWLGPDEWLAVLPDGAAADTERHIRARAGNDPWLSVVDVSHNYSGLLLAGPAAREVLAKGCPLDLHPRSFRGGDCAQTVLAGTRILLRCLDGEASMELLVRNSFARYTAAWLMDAMAEYETRGAGAFGS